MGFIKETGYELKIMRLRQRVTEDKKIEKKKNFFFIGLKQTYNNKVHETCKIS